MTMVTKNMNGSVMNDAAFLIIEKVGVTWGREVNAHLLIVVLLLFMNEGEFIHHTSTP